MEKYNNILNFYKDYIKLEQVIRKGWLMCNVPAKRLESVADHTLQLIMLASVFTKELNMEVDLKKLMEMLLIHDLGETIIGDISEVEEDRKNKKVKEAEAIKEIFNNLSDETSKYYYSLWIEMETQTTELAKFAYLLDKIDAVIKAGIYEEEFNINNLFKEFSELQTQRKTFENSLLEEFFEFIKIKFNQKKVK